MRRFLAALLLALLLAGGAQAQGTAMAVANCGTIPMGNWPLGSVVNLTQNQTGQLCVNASVTATANTTVAVQSTLPTLAAGTQTPTASPAGAAYVQPVFGSAAGGGTQVDITHGLPVNIVAGAGAGGTSSSFGGAFPAAGTAAGFKDGGGLMQPALVDGSGNQNVNIQATVTLPISAASLPLPAGAATSAKQPAIGTAGTPSADVISVQGEASMTPLKVDGSAVTQPVSGTVTANQGTANATPWNENVAQIAGTAPAMKASGTNAATTDPALVVAPSPNPSTVCTSSVAVNQTASTDLVTSTNKLHICSIVLISASAQNISLVEGTGSVCATGIAALIGGTAASVAVAANGGFSAVSERAWLVTKTTADHVCILQSGAGNVSGVITYTDHN